MENSQAEVDRLEKELDAVLAERQWVITQVRKGKINESDMDSQLAALSFHEAAVKKELAICQQKVDVNALDGWEHQVREHLADLRAGLESLNAPPQNDGEAHEQFQDKRRIVQTLVERVNIGGGREIRVVFKLEVMTAIRHLAEFRVTKMGGTCTHTPTSRARRLVVVCA